MDFRLIATCPDELKGILAAELHELGAEDIEPGYRAVEFSADEKLYYRSHLRLTTASSLLRIVKKSAAKTPQMLFMQARRIPWHSYFGNRQTYRIDGSAGNRGEEYMSSNAISKQVRLGIEDAFAYRKLEAPRVNLEEPDILITVLVRNGRACFSINTSGKSLHKRGYRHLSHPAPLKETLAAAMLSAADYEGQQPLFDPMCGSGTLVIEAATLALNKACHIHRKKDQFGFEHLKDFNRSLWREIQEEERTKQKKALDHPIFASDLEESFVAMSRTHALKARVEKYIQFGQGSFFDIDPPKTEAGGLLVSNLPYGERLSNPSELEAFFKDFGNTLKQKYQGWTACLLVNDESPWQAIGLKPKRKISVLNGSIRAKILIYELYAGSRKAKHRS